MKFSICIVILCASLASAEEAPAAGPEARKREYAALQKELEAARPLAEPTREEILAYVELSIEKYGKFAKNNPQTAEGFEAASTLAAMLSQMRHQDALKYAELAANSAPAAGVDIRRLAVCWAMVADGRLQKEDAAGSQAALEKIKLLDNAMYEQLAAQFKEAQKQLAAQREAAERLQVGKEPFPIDDKDIKGNAVSLAGLKGKVVIIDFWASWCGPCMNEMPDLVELYNAQRVKGLEILGISLDQDKGILKETIGQQGMSWPILSDYGGWQNAIARKWGIRALPATFVIDRKGVIRHVGLRGAELIDAVKKLVDEP